MQNPEQRDKQEQCMYHKTTYAVRENSVDVKCDRLATKLVSCSGPKFPGSRGTFDEDLRLCWKHYRIVDTYQGEEWFRNKSRRK